MHPLLRILDIGTHAGTESSVYELHPVRDAASARSRRVPFLLSLGLTPLIIYGLSISLISPSSIRTINGALDQARRSVSLMMQEPDTPTVISPTRNPVGAEGPGGLGHREGTGTLDSRLAVFTSILSEPSDAIDPEALSTSLKAERAFLSLNPALPLQNGGNGLAQGTGRDSAKGAGGLIRPQKAFDFELIAIHQVSVYHRLTPGEANATKGPVRVRIFLGDDGVPFQAIVISGPSFLHQECLQAALQWRFEPLAGHGLHAPISMVLTFHPEFLKPS